MAITEREITNLRNGKPHTETKERLTIAPLRQAIITIPVIGETPLRILRFSQKAMNMMETTQRAGEQAKNRRKRAPKDFEGLYKDAQYTCTVKEKGKQVTWQGLNAASIRNGCIETCRVSGYPMTKAKMSIFCIADGKDDKDGTSLVRIFGEPAMTIDPVRNANGSIDLRPRVKFEEWRLMVRLRFDEDQFSPSDILNLMIRVGQQNGLGDFRPNGSNGNGGDGGLFQVDADHCTLERLSSKPTVFEE